MNISAIALALVLLGAGCGKKEESPAPETAAPPAPEATAPAAPTAESVEPAKAIEVSIKNFKFSPSSVTVKKGTTVTWTQEDGTSHTVTVDRGDGPDSPVLKKGETYSYKFEKAGTYKYHCTPHPNMKGTVVVEEE